MNLILLTIVVSEVCLGICLWYTPQLLRRFGAHLLTRADVIEAARHETLRRMTFWRRELGLNCQVVEAEHLPAMTHTTGFARN